MTDPATAIELKNICKAYGALRVIDDVSLTIERGVFITLLGPSGCGKSTLLRSIVGLAEPDSGTILVDGKDITSAAAHNRPVKMVFQDYALFPHMTVAQNIGFGCEMQGMEKSAIARRATELLELIRLPGIANRYPDALSGGQRQRVALARALAPDPAALLLDEPLGALDLKLRQDMQRELKAIQRRTGKTFVFVTHDQQEAMSMSDLVAVMNKGKIEQLDSPENIYANPATLFIADFVGATNLFKAKVEAMEGEDLVLAVGDARWCVPMARVTSQGKPAVGGAVSVVIRPEAFDIGAGQRMDDITLSGRVIDQTYLGDRVHLNVETADGASLLVDARPPVPARSSADITLRCRPDNLAIIAE
ncbi:ABC transporter ATP-binding protein [Nitratireductor sp. GISD-1A_MAKvit]|uniref:ABC transporter ATP-binding protein n=1 Tax=Nitratireductor sp. GISD-1A_MAKvit TaxID=3234198 RepID=UPI003467D33B